MRRILRNAVLTLAAVTAVSGHAESRESPYSALERANLAVVNGFWEQVFMARNPDRARHYLAVDYVDHNPNLARDGGLAGFVAFLSMVKERLPVPAGAEAPGKTVATLVDGEFVTLLRQRSLPNPFVQARTYDAFKFETFRVRNGRITEHWDSGWSDIRK